MKDVIIKKAIEMLIEELGAVESIKHREKWQKTLDQSTFFDEIFAE